jgi:hypothetical protein
MRIRATHEEIIAHPIKVGIRFSAMFFPVFLLIMWFQGNKVPLTFGSLAFLMGLFAFSSLVFGFLLKLIHGWSDSNAR